MHSAFRKLADEFGFNISCPMDDPPEPGMTETKVPFEAVQRLEQISTLSEIVIS